MMTPPHSASLLLFIHFFFLPFLTTTLGEDNSSASRISRLAVLPVFEMNNAARKARLSKTSTASLRLQLTNRPDVSLIDGEKAIELFQNSPALLTSIETPKTIQVIAKELQADFVLVSWVARYGTTAQEATYLDVRLFDGKTGSLAGWTCERGDLVWEASMTISNPEMEQIERLGSYIVACLREAPQKLATAEKRTPVIVFPFKEPGQDSHGEAAARMFATDLMVLCPFRVLPTPRVPQDPDAKTLIELARQNSATYVFLGEVESSTSSLSQVRASQMNVATGKTERSGTESYSSDVDLRAATANLAHRFSSSGNRILWRSLPSPGQELTTTPCFSDGKLFIGAGGVENPLLAALDPLTGTNLWTYVPVSASSVGTRFFSPCIFADVICLFGPACMELQWCDPKTGKKLGEIGITARGQPAFDARMVADDTRLFVPSSAFQLVAYEMTNEPKLKIVWKFAEHSSLMLGHGLGQDRVVVASRNGRVSALAKQDGKPLWHRQLPDRIDAGPFVTTDRVSIASEDGNRFFLSLADGAILWSMQDRGRSLAVAAADEAKVYFSTDGGALTCFRSNDGEVLWKSTLGEAAQASLTHYQGLLYAPCADGFLYCLDAETGKTRWQVNLRGAILSSPVVVATETLLANPEADPADWTDDFDHVVYVTSTDGYVYAIGGNLPK